MENGYSLATMSLDCHYCVWFDIAEYHSEYQSQNGFQKYLDYCKRNGVTRELLAKESGFKYYHFVNAESEAAFDEYIAKCKELSLYDTGVSAEYGDKLITLSTCEYSQTNGRMVVVAKKVASPPAADGNEA